RPSLMLSLKTAFLFQTITGISANSFLILSHIFTIFLEHRLKLTDLITCHLALNHIVMLLTVLLLLSPHLFESLDFQNDFRCKAFFYLNRVMRGLSISTTCLLNVLQAVTISPSTSWLARFKQKLTSYSIHILVSSWSLSLCSNTYLIIYAVASSSVNQTQLLVLTEHCSLSPMNSIIRGMFLTLIFSSDVFFVGVMLLSSAYMVILLCRHQRLCQYLHSTSLSSRLSPERRAIQTLLLLVSLFVVMYWMNLAILSFSALSWINNFVILGVQKLLVNVYATVSPLVLISSHKKIRNILQYMQWKCHQFFNS
uniref:Vomeronasal type-1 receptor n=2 Tax=Mustela putorius furo TaxID=9669 RepID=M3Z4B6_MUSPF